MSPYRRRLVLWILCLSYITILITAVVIIALREQSMATPPTSTVQVTSLGDGRRSDVVRIYVIEGHRYVTKWGSDCPLTHAESCPRKQVKVETEKP